MNHFDLNQAVESAARDSRNAPTRPSRFAWHLIGGWRLSINLRHGWRALLASPRRFAFSCASLSIGIGAMIAVLGIGQSIHAHAQRQFEGAGVQLVRFSSNTSHSVAITGEPQRDRLNLPLLQHAIRQSGTAPVARLELNKLDRCVVQAGISAEVVGFRGDLARMLGPPLAAGRMVSALDGSGNWALFGHELAREMTRQAGFLPLGQSVQVCGVTLRVAGVLQKARDDAYLMPFNVNHSAMLTQDALARLGNSAPVADVLLHFADTSEVELRAERIRRDYLAIGGLDVQLTTPGQMLALLRAQESALVSSLLVTGLVVLFIGAFGIMENLLSSVNERRAEIGIRLSVGASPRDIRQQFASEALMLVAAGGAVGLLLGTLASWGYAQMRGMPFVASSIGALATLGLIALIGFGSGFFPARRAAMVDPINAIIG